MSPNTIALLAVFTFLVNTCQAYFPANHSTYLNFHIPVNLRHNESWLHAASNFGRWGHGPEGSLVLPVKMFSGNHSHTFCDNYDFDVVRRELKIPADNGAPFILLVERGDCTYVRKVRNAQQLGAAAVLIADTKHSLLPVVDPDDDADILFLDHSNHTDHATAFRMGDDGSGKDISIPSMMIAKPEYEDIKSAIDSKPNSTGTVVAEMAWHVPKFENKVVMDLWHSPIDTHSRQFLASNFSVLAKTFDLNGIDSKHYDTNKNLLEFHEYPVLLDGTALGCKGNSKAPDEPCYKLCTNGGRYCHVSHHHTDGKDIVMESLRRLCISKHTSDPKIYWDYIDFFSKNCFEHDHFANEACIEDAYKHSSVNTEDVKSCFSDSGDPEKDGENSFLQHTLEIQHRWGIQKSPSVLINHEPAVMVDWQGLSTRSVLFSLCETFAYGEKPHVCYACMHCGDPVACAQRSPMKCLATDGVEKEDTNAHKDKDKTHHHSKHSKVGRWFFGLFLLGGCTGAYVYYKKQMEGPDGLGSYSLQDAFLSDGP